MNLFGILSPWGSSNYRPSVPFLYEVASHVKNCHFGNYYYYYVTDFGQQQMENAAIVFSSWQRPPLLIDPYGDGISSLHQLNADMNSSPLTKINMDTRYALQKLSVYRQNCLVKKALQIQMFCINWKDKSVEFLFALNIHRNSNQFYA